MAEKNNEVKNETFLERVGNFFRRIGKKIAKFCKDTFGEMKKVTWTSKKDTVANSKLVLITVIAVGLAIAIVDVACSKLINGLAGLIG